MKGQTLCAGERGEGGPGLGAGAMTSDFEDPCEDLVQALSSPSCVWKTLGYKTGISIILDKKRILEL